VSRIGPNAILQLVPVLDEALGAESRARLLATAGIAQLPDGRSMIDEGPVVRLHQALRAACPDEAAELAARAGRRTGDYILAHRIPKPAARVLAMLPAPFAARLLARAIGRHAWTFAGSGRFRIAGFRPLTFEIDDNPLVRGETSPTPLCVWHAQVFERLYRVLVADDYRATETACGAVTGGACRFELTRERNPGQ
jgi:divinyl protochlorophyllide a 8-vinyl-reductase